MQILTLVEATGSFSAAAERVNLTASAVSKRMADLEYQLGLPLVRRTPQGVELTQCGYAVVRSTGDIFDRLSALTEDLTAYRDGSSGAVRVVSNISSLLLGLGETISAFATAHPNVHVRVEEVTSAEAVEMILDGRADVGLCAEPVETPGLTSRVFSRTPLVLLVPDTHPLADRDYVTDEDIWLWPHIGRKRGSALAALPTLPSKTASAPIFETSVTSFDSVFQLVHDGAGVAVLPKAALVRRSMTQLVAIPIREHWAELTLIRVSDATRIPEPVVARFLDWLTKAGKAERASGIP